MYLLYQIKRDLRGIHKKGSRCSERQKVETGGSKILSPTLGGERERVQDDMSKAKSVCRDWQFVSKGTEISLGKFVSEYFTTLTLGLQTGVVSTEDTDEIWETAKEEVMEKTKGRETRRARADSPMVVETEVEKSFWFSRPDGWVINRKAKKIMLFEFKRTSDCGESYFQDMRRVSEQ